MLEVEYYRRLASEVVGLTITGVSVDDPHALAGPLRPSDLIRALEGRSFTTARRTGKVLFFDSSGDSATNERERGAPA